MSRRARRKDEGGGGEAGRGGGPSLARRRRGARYLRGRDPPPTVATAVVLHLSRGAACEGGSSLGRSWRGVAVAIAALPARRRCRPSVPQTRSQSARAPAALRVAERRRLRLRLCAPGRTLLYGRRLRAAHEARGLAHEPTAGRTHPARRRVDHLEPVGLVQRGRKLALCAGSARRAAA